MVGHESGYLWKITYPRGMSIRSIHLDTIKFLKQSGTFEPDDVIV